uniref:Phosphatidylcholine-sterol acyltransferase (Lecithin-cholesterol acyltransferase)/ Phospholipase A n=1 Tax=Schistosoma mansoni TaxID=6183 RepID=A0A5K4ETG6_SCHMA
MLIAERRHILFCETYITVSLNEFISFSYLFVQLITDLAYAIMNETKSVFDPYERPTDIDVYCIYSINIPTISQMIFKTPGPYRSAFPNQIPTLKYGDGDGTVPLKSLSVCNKWDYVNLAVLEQTSHEDIVQDDRFLKYLMKLLVID